LDEKSQLHNDENLRQSLFNVTQIMALRWRARDQKSDTALQVSIHSIHN
jgi:hypothetical protein